ncbi:MAG: CHASE2 domain-containing protein, partial [Verrucomicrobiota bacterium]
MKFLPPYFIHLLLPPLALLLALGIAQTPLGKKMEYLTVDSRFQARAPHDPPAHPDLLLVGIGEQGIEHFGQWPWPRSIHGQLLQLLQLRPPTAITFDLIFSEPSQDSGHDDVFASGLEMHPGAITGTSAEDLGHLSADATADSVPGPFIGNTPALTRLTGDPSAIPGQDFALMPIPKLAETSLTGFVNVAPSAVDGYRRQVPLVIRVGSGEEAQVYPSLVLQTLMRKEHLGPQQVEIVLGSAITLHGEDHQWRIPIDESGRMTINYRGNLQEESNVFLHNEISYFGLTYFLLEHAAQHNAGEKTLWPKDYQPNPDDPSTRYPVPPVEDQFLLIGQTAAGLTDFGPTPLGKQTPLVRVHASALNNILQNDYLRTFPDWPIILGWLLLGWPLSLIL